VPSRCFDRFVKLRDVSRESLTERIWAKILRRRSGKSIAKVWNEALTLHRVRYAKDVLTEEEEPQCP
jgi:hypothetical protein